MKCFIAALCVVLSGCLTAPNFLGFSFGPSAYQKQEDLPNGTVMLSDSERFSATVNRYWVYAPADTHISSTEYDLEHYGVQLLKDGPAAIGKSATVIGEYHAFYVAEVEGLGYLFAPKFDIRDQIEQKRAQAEYERNYQALIKLFRSKESISPPTGYIEIRKALAEHMPRIGDKLKIEVVPQGLKTGGKSLNEANQFGFSGFPTNLPEGPDNPYPFDFSGSGLFVAKAFAAYRATGYPFFLEFTVYGTVIDTSLSIFLQADYMTLPGPESEITVRIENRDLTTEEILHINDN